MIVMRFSMMRREESASHPSPDAIGSAPSLLQRAILYRHERILLGREDCRPGPKKTICKNLVVFH